MNDDVRAYVRTIKGERLPPLVWLHRERADTRMWRDRWADPVMEGHGASKPIGGLWFAPVVPHPVGGLSVPWSTWADWLETNSPEWFADRYAWLSPVTVLPGSRFALIDNRLDAYRLCARFPMRLPWWGMMIDWEALAGEFDGVFMTAEGERETRYMSAMSSGEASYWVPGDVPGTSVRAERPTVYGWDCATVWLARPVMSGSMAAIPTRSDSSGYA